MPDPRIAIVQKVIPPYRVPIFRMLSERLNSVVCHSRKRRNSNFTTVADPPFPNLRLEALYYGRSDTNLIQNLLPIFRRPKPDIIISEFALGFLSFWLLLLIRKAAGFKLVAWTHGISGEELDHPFRTRKSKIKRWVYERVDAIITYSPRRQQILKEHLSNPEKVFLAQNTLDIEHLHELNSRFEGIGREKIKEELGFRKRFNLIFIGRLRAEKGIAFLLEAFPEICAHHDVELHFVGNGEEEHLIEAAIARGLPIRFHGPVYGDEEAGRLLFASDLLVMPGMVGLSLIHGFAFALPTITLEMQDGWPVHSPEIEFLQDGVNGLLCRREDYAHSVSALLADAGRLRRMRANAQFTARNECSLETMLRGFGECVAWLQKRG